MESKMPSIDVLKECLRSVPQAKPIPDDVLLQLLSCVADAWLSFHGADSHNTHSNKLHRAENVRWEPPLLKFTLERHGATVNGSTRGVLHHWEVNVQSRVAEIVRIGQRQLYQKDSPLKVKELASETRNRIVSHEQHDSLKWINESQVLINIGEIVPATYARTTQDRRKKFCAALDSFMEEAGWEKAYQGNKAGYQRIQNDG